MLTIFFVGFVLQLYKVKLKPFFSLGQQLMVPGPK
jgi:hypothetical protein